MPKMTIFIFPVRRPQDQPSGVALPAVTGTETYFGFVETYNE